jgi:hypothetical protein
VGGKDLSKLESAVREFQGRDERTVDPKGLRAIIDALEAEFSEVARRCQEAGVHHANGNPTIVTWLSRLCGMSATSAADRLCVGTLRFLRPPCRRPRRLLPRRPRELQAPRYFPTKWGRWRAAPDGAAEPAA